MTEWTEQILDVYQQGQTDTLNLLEKVVKQQADYFIWSKPALIEAIKLMRTSLAEKQREKREKIKGDQAGGVGQSRHRPNSR